MSYRPIPTPGASTGTTSYCAGSGDLDWQERAACRGADRELFFTPDGMRGADRRAREAEAKAVCDDCPVLLECRRYALDTREPYGVWGGLDEEEREAIYAGTERSPMQPPNSSPAWKAGQDAAAAARRTRAETDRAALVADIEHLAGAGADIHAAARAAGRSTEALERALQRAKRHDLVARLKKAA